MAMTQKPADPHSPTGDVRTNEQIERDRQAKFDADKKAEDTRVTDADKEKARGEKNAPKQGDGEDSWRHADRPAPDPNAPRKGAPTFDKAVGPNEDPNSSGKLDPAV
jgi:hypothetical protein